MPAVAEVISEFLKIMGFSSQVVHTAHAGLSQCQTQTFDLAVIDGGLPDKEGPLLVREIKFIQPSLPILGIGSGFYAEEFYYAGVNAFLPKPFTFAQFQSAIKKIIPPQPSMVNHRNFYPLSQGAE